MLWFWFAAAVLAGGAALLVTVCARWAVGRVGAENPALAVHRRQLSEIDDLADRGLLGEADKSFARAEAGRRLLSTAALEAKPERPGGPGSRRIAAGGAVAAAALSLALYVLLGAPGAPDQPYKARVAAWRKADPATLDPQRMAAVLQVIAADRPSDPQVFGFLGRVQMAAGDPFAAQKAFARGAALAPNDPAFQLQLAEALIAALGDKPSAQARAETEAAFRRVLVLDPQNTPARYALGRLRIANGDRAGGLAAWRALLADLSQGDPRRTPLTIDIDRVAAGGPLDAPPPPEPAAAGADPSTFIRGMVASLAARLKANPDDADGWARLVRSYGVLHDAPAQADTLAKARKQFAGQAAALASIETEAKQHPAR